MTFSCINNFCNYIINIIDDKRVIKYDNLKIKYFICKTKPSICIKKYIKNIFASGIVNNNNIDGVILYTINLLQYLIKKGIVLNSYNCHRLILTLIMISSKIYEEYVYSNSDWAYICGTNLKDINNMEINILKILDYNLHIITQEKAISIYKCIY